MRTLPLVAALIATLVLAAPAGAAVKRLEANLRGSSATDAGIEVDLITAPESGDRFTGCTADVAKSKIRRILRRPRRFYVNVHTGTLPGGAIQGRLHKP